MADLSKLKRGKEALASSGGKGKYLPAIYWKNADDTRYLAYLTPLSEVPKLPIHMLETAQGWRTFVCRKAEIFEDENPKGECYICDSDVFTDRQKNPAWKFLALAVELEATQERIDGRQKTTGFTILMDEWDAKDEEGKDIKRQAPHVGIVSQARTNFWTPFTAEVEREVNNNGIGDLNEVVYEIVRIGKGKDGTSYKFYAYDMRPDLTEYMDTFPSLEDWIEDKGSLAHYEESLSGGVETDESEDGDSPTTSPKEVEEEPSDKFEALKASLEDREKAEKAALEESAV